MLIVHRFHNNIQLHYVFVLLVLFEGQRHHVGSDYNAYLPSNPGRLLVLLRVLVDYRHDGKAFDARYKGGLFHI